MAASCFLLSSVPSKGERIITLSVSVCSNSAEIALAHFVIKLKYESPSFGNEISVIAVQTSVCQKSPVRRCKLQYSSCIQFLIFPSLTGGFHNILSSCMKH